MVLASRTWCARIGGKYCQTNSGSLTFTSEAFAVVDLCAQNRGKVRFPRFVGFDPVDRAVEVLDSELRPQRRLGDAVVIRLAVPLQRCRVPARRQKSADGVFPG